jgi:hypothetical protein
MLARLALFAAVAALAGCGDDTTTGADMSVAAADLSMPAGGPTCAQYCDKIALSCAAFDGGSFAQYADTAACNAWCTTAAGWPAGVNGAQSGNTIACRDYHAGAAAANPAVHCPHAGPTGGGLCGSYCENYCQLMARNCTGANAVYDMTTCMSKCAMIPTNGNANDQAGNSVQCRIWYLGQAATDAATNCPNARTAADFATGPCT